MAEKKYIKARTIGGVEEWIEPSSLSGNMVYPSAGIALSSGSGWSGSIADNSAHWNEAYSWGNHASAGYALNSRVDGIEAIMSTDTERLNAVNQLTASYTAADTSLNNTLTAALTQKANINNPSFTGNLNVSGTVNAVVANAGCKAYFSETENTINENHENFILVGGYALGYGQPTVVGHHYNAGAGYGFLGLYGQTPAIKWYSDGSSEFFSAMKLGNWSFALDGTDLVMKYNGTVVHKFTTPSAGKSNILSTGGQGVNQSI